MPGINELIWLEYSISGIKEHFRCLLLQTLLHLWGIILINVLLLLLRCVFTINQRTFRSKTRFIVTLMDFLYQLRL